MAKLSIIIPVYNPPIEYLVKCLDSIIDQTLKDIEIIIIDNASLGYCPKILEEFAKRDPRIKIIKLHKNIGAAGAINCGIHHSTTEYFQIVDSDDCLKPDACEILWKEINKTNADLILFQVDSINHTNNKLNIYNTGLERILKGQKERQINIETDAIDLFNTTLCYWNKIYKKHSVIERNNYLEEKLTNVLPDVLFVIKQFCISHKIYAISNSLYTYNAGLGVLEGYKKKNCTYWKAPFIFARQILKFIDTENMSYNLKNSIFLAMWRLLTQYWGFAHPSLKYKYFKELKKLLKHRDFDIFLPKSGNSRQWANDIKKLKFTQFAEKEKIDCEISWKNLSFYSLTNKNNSKTKKYFGGLFKIKENSKHKKYYFLSIPVYKNKTTLNNEINIEIKQLNAKIDSLTFQLKLENDKALIRSSSLWNENYYITLSQFHPKKFPDISDALEHYLTIGWKQGINPSPTFDGNSYLARYKNVKINPLLHFLKLGRFYYYWAYEKNAYSYDEKQISTYLNYKKDRKTDRVIYICIIGNYDDLNEIKAYTYFDKEWDYVCFTDNHDLINQKQFGIWEIRPLQYTKMDNTRNNRWHKLHPHILFPEYKESIYLDANINIISPYIFNHLKEWNKKFLFPQHCCNFELYQENLNMIQSKIDHQDLLQNGIDQIKASGFPQGYGLSENNLIYRQHHDQQIINTMNDWWNMIEKYAKRDQCYFSYALWKNNLSVQDYLIPNTRILYNDFCVFIHKANRS